MLDYQSNATLLSREDLHEELCILKVKPDSGEFPNFSPGQYAELALPDFPGERENKKLVRRSFSIASPPTLHEYLEFCVVLVPNGYFTPKLWTLKTDDRLWLGPKIKGKFVLDDLPTDKNFIMVATGTGLAPFISMLREFGTKSRWHRCVIIHGVRYVKDLAYREELEDWARKLPNFIYLPTVTREPESSGWTGLRGRIQGIFEKSRFESLVDFPLTPEECHLFLCGNPEMIDSTQALLEPRGFREHSKKNPGNLHFERYW